MLGQQTSEVETMKYVNFFLVLIVVVSVTGCATVPTITIPPLVSAAYRGDINAVNALLDSGADVNEQTSGETALLAAAGRGHTEIVKLLINRGADINAMAQKGWSPLGDAARYDWADIVEILIAQGADIDKAIMGLKQRAVAVADHPVAVSGYMRGIHLITNKAGWIYYSNGQYQKAISAFRLDVGLSPYINSNLIGISRSYYALKQYGEAINSLSQVKDSATARLLEAMAHAKQGNFKKAVDIYSAIPEEDLSANNIPLWSDRTALLEELKPFTSSKRENAAKLKAQGKYREALVEFGDVLRGADDAESREVYKTMAEILRAEPQLARVPEEARKYTLRGEMMAEEGKIKEAAEQFRLALNIAPYIAKFHFKTAIIYGELQRYSQAARYMKTYLLLAPEAPNARAAQDQIYKWEFMIEQGG